jgi:hypothetical protein
MERTEGGTIGYQGLLGAASVRGRRWAELVVRQLVTRWPARWPGWAKAVFKAGRQVDDMVGLNEAIRPGAHSQGGRRGGEAVRGADGLPGGATLGAAQR